jgi:hypothetical protein
MFRTDIFDEFEEEDSFDELLFQHEEQQHIFWDTIREEIMDNEEDNL